MASARRVKGHSFSEVLAERGVYWVAVQRLPVKEEDVMNYRGPLVGMGSANGVEN